MATRTRVVLVVEDDPDIRDALGDALELEGFKVLTAANGSEGLDRMRLLPTPDAILLDLHMPVMDGYEVLRELARDLEWRKVPVFLTTAAIEHQLPVGVELQGIFRKPYDFEVLVSAVRAVLARIGSPEP